MIAISERWQKRTEMAILFVYERRKDRKITSLTKEITKKKQEKT